MRQDQISLQLYTVREETARDMPGTLRRISEIGYPAVEFAGYGDLSPQDLKSIIDDLGIRASGAHVPFDSWETDPESVITDMHTLDCAHAILPIAPPEYCRDEAVVAGLAESLNRWGELCRQESVTFSYHNHDFEFAPLDGTTMWDVLVRETDPGLVHFELDLYWVRYGGADPEPLLSDLGDRIPLVHLKDMASDDTRSDLPVGEGIMPWTSLLEAADAARVQWYVAEQDNPRDALEDVRTSLQSMRNLTSG
ncbi:MAG: sugar phosphate isomerase/epimerase [Rubrobacteraceae bacterium]|nr:sugar phosphate isomerase/epimerase [Rubrobacteraceae bacterium]